MDSCFILGADELRDKARHYRGLAKGSLPLGVAAQLDAIADECEREAARLEGAQPSPDREPEPCMSGSPVRTLSPAESA